MCFAAVAPLGAQSTLGVVLGSVRDASGAVVAGAAIKLTNVGENTSREATSNANGDYEFQSVKAGQYSLTVTQAGFRNFTARDFSVAARQTVRVDAALQVGDVTQTDRKSTRLNSSHRL